MRCILPIISLAWLASAVAFADDVKWGDPVNGLRIGVKNPATSATSDQAVAFDIEVQNVSAKPLTIPTPDTFLSVDSPLSNDYHATPLAPTQDSIAPTPVPTPGYFDFAGNTSSETGPSVDHLRPSVLTLAPGQTVTWSGIPLEKHYYFGDRLHDGNRTSIESWGLQPDSVYQLHFCFANAQKRVAGADAWTGVAESAVFGLSISSPGPDGMNVTGTFTLPKQTYDLGEPIKVTFTVTNKGGVPIAYMDGCDYRGSGRHDRFSIKAVSSASVPVPDPVRPSPMGGGLGGDIDLALGASHSEDLYVNQWCAFRLPGTYTVTCRRTLNLLRTDKNPNPIAMMSREWMLPKVPVETTFTITLRNEAPDLGQRLATLLPLDLKKGELGQDAYWAFACAAGAQSPAAFPLIAKLLGGNPSLQYCAIGWLGDYPMDQAAPLLLDAFDKLDRDGQQQVFMILGDHDAPQAGSFFARNLHNPDEQVRNQALVMCTYRGYEACTPVLLKMVATIPPDQRRWLAMALGNTGSPQAIPILLDWLRDPDVDRFAALSLGKFKRMDGVPVLAAHIEKARSREEAFVYLEPLDTLTGQKFGDNRAAFLDWWKKTGRLQYETKTSRE